jgi:hypothetical protein
MAGSVIEQCGEMLLKATGAMWITLKKVTRVLRITIRASEWFT